MSRVLICLVLTLCCAFGSYESFMSNDYGPIKEWISYYKEYKEIQAALAKGTESKEELLAKLEKMYPQHASEIEARFKEKYGDLKASAQDAKSSFHERWNTYTDQNDNDTSSQQPRRSSRMSRDGSSDTTDSRAQRPSRMAEPDTSSRSRSQQRSSSSSDSRTGSHDHNRASDDE